MKDTGINEILYTLRKQKKLSQEQLCLGLCSKSTYSHYESGDRIPDRLLLHTFLQRMGKSGDRLSTVLSVEEYEYFNWRKKTLQFINQEDFEHLQDLLKSADSCYTIINPNLQQQYTLFLQAVLTEQVEHNIPKAIQLLQQALTLTMPEIGIHNLEEYLISTEEMSLLLTLSNLFIQGDRKEDAFSLLSQILSYIEHHYDDKDSKVKVFPAAAKLFALLLLEKEQEVECMLLCQKAIELLRWHGILYDMADLIEILLKCDSLLKPSDFLHLEKQLQALKEFYKEYHVESNMQKKCFFVYANQSIYLLNEIISKHRVSKCISQETLSEGICSPETLSRIESGKRTPNARNFHAFMTKLDTNLDYYNEDVDTDNYWLLEKKKNLDRMLSLKNWKQAQEMLDDLKAELNMNHPKNKRYIDSIEDCILFNTGELSADAFLHHCCQALNCEYESWLEEDFWRPFFTYHEVTLLNYVALIYESNQEIDKSILILEHLLAQLNQSEVKLEDRYKSSMTAIGNLSTMYGQIGEFDQCLFMCEKGIQVCLDSAYGMRLPNFLVNKAEALNDKAKQPTQESKRLLKWAYYISDLMSTYSASSYINQYYRNHYDKDVCWY